MYSKVCVMLWLQTWISMGAVLAYEAGGKVAAKPSIQQSGARLGRSVLQGTQNGWHFTKSGEMSKIPQEKKCLDCSVKRWLG